MPTLTQSPATDAVVKAAQDVPQLLAGLNTLDPTWQQQLAGKSLWTTKSVPVTIVSIVVGKVVAHYGLACAAGAVAATCWTPDTVSMVSDGIGLGLGVIAGYIMRYFTRVPIAKAAPAMTQGTST